MRLNREICCAGTERHVKSFATNRYTTSRGDHCYCGSSWDQEDEAAALAHAQEMDIIGRIKSGDLTYTEKQYVSALKRDYLAASANGSPALSSATQEALRKAFVARWATRFNLSPDDDQLAAIATGWCDTLVEARAGSGKSRTIIARVLFLVDICGVAPDSIIILAFNNRAAEELKGRLRTYHLPTLPHVMTFHALARRIVQPEEEIIFDSADDSTDRGQIQSQVVDNIVRDFFSHSHNEQRVRELLRYRFSRDDQRADQELLFDSKAEAVKFRKRIPLVTLASEKVKSYGEQQIANALFCHDIRYDYERAFPSRLDGAVYRPDFTILPAEPGGKTVVIEYFGMTGNENYDRVSAAKRRFWKEQNALRYAFLEYGPNDIRQGRKFEKRLIEDLTALGVPNETLSSEEIWKRMRKGAILEISRALKSFVQQARKRGWGREMAREAVFNHTVLDGQQGELEERFYDLAIDVFDVYLESLDAHNQIDFDELLNRAVRMVQGEQTVFCKTREDRGGNLKSIRAVLVDEFQDFNSQFDALLNAARAQMSSPTLFAVGDPWQAINSFAGASTEYFTSFTKRYPGAAHHVIATNYRSSRAVVEVGNKIMQDRQGEPARVHSTRVHLNRPEKVRIFNGTTVPHHNKTAPEVKFTNRSDAYISLDVRTKARLVTAAIKRVPDDGRLFVLSRTAGAAEDVRKAVRPYFSTDELKRSMFATVHQSKGLEADYVVLLDGGSGMFPLVHPNWVFGRIFGDNVPDIERDEQNLLYVAITRASKETWVLMPHGDRSVFLPAPSSVEGLTNGDWADIPALAIIGKISVNVSGFERKEQLKSLGFVFDMVTEQWSTYVDGVSEGVALLSRIDAHRNVKATITDSNASVEQHFAIRNWPPR